MKIWKRMIAALLLPILLVPLSSAQWVDSEGPLTGQLEDGTTVPILIDEATNAITSIDFEHHEQHEGCHYFIKTWASVASGDTIRFMFRTPDTTTRIHARVHIATEVEYTAQIYENPTLWEDGTPTAGFNNDRDSVNTSELSPFFAPGVSIGGEGALMWATKLGSGKDATVAPGISYEIIAATDEVYLFNLINTSNVTGWIDVDFWWYEHASSN